MLQHDQQTSAAACWRLYKTTERILCKRFSLFFFVSRLIVYICVITGVSLSVDHVSVFLGKCSQSMLRERRDEGTSVRVSEKRSCDRDHQRSDDTGSGDF